MTDGSRRAFFAAFVANPGIVISKFIDFLITGPASLPAETIHSAADTGGQLPLFLGGQRARKSATPEHPFGDGRERYVWSFAVALVLFSMGGMFALYEHVGPDEILVGARVEYASTLSTDELVEAINPTEDASRAAVATVTVIHFEPGLHRLDLHRLDLPGLVTPPDAGGAH